MTEDFTFKQADLINPKEIADMIKQKLHVEILNTVTWQVRDIAKDKALELLAPEIGLIIEEGKQEILQGVRDGMADVAKALATQMLSNAVKNLDGYNGKDIMKKLFAD